MKRTFLCSLGILLISTSMAMGAITLNVPTVSGTPGKSLAVPINVDNATGIAGGSITLKYDSNILTATSAKGGDLIAGFSFESNLALAGEVKLSMANATGLKEGSGAIAQIAFDVKATASLGSTSALVLSKAKLYDENAQAPAVNIVNGSFTVSTVKVTGSPAIAGGQITITLTAGAGGKAFFSIVSVVSDVPMSESPQTPGVYIGTYTATGTVTVRDAVVSIVFTDSAGNSITDTSQKVTIDTIAVITSVKVDGSPARPGDKIIVTLIGEGGGNAKFSIENVVADVPVQEAKPTPPPPENQSVYTGEYTAEAGVNAINATVTVTLTDALGNVSKDVSQRVIIIYEFTITLESRPA